MKNRNKTIPASELTAYERWELPSLGESAPKKTPAPQQEEIKPLTAADLEQIRQQAYDEGFAQGKEEGHAAGMESGHAAGHEQGLAAGKEQGMRDGQAHIKQTQQQLTRLMQCLSEPLSEEQAQVTETMLNVTLAITRSVIRRELQLDSTVIQEVILEALSALPRHSKGVVFRVNAVDADYVRESLEAADSLAEVRVDDAIQAGGCEVDTHTQQYDFTIEKRFQKLVHQMLMNAASVDQGAQKAASNTSPTMEERADFHREVLSEAEAESGFESRAESESVTSVETSNESSTDSNAELSNETNAETVNDQSEEDTEAQPEVTEETDKEASNADAAAHATSATEETQKDANDPDEASAPDATVSETEQMQQPSEDDAEPEASDV